MIPGVRRWGRSGLLLLLVGAGIGLALAAGVQQRNLGYSDTPLLPGGKWHVHDGNRPQPKVIDPGTAGTAASPGRPPADAVVLFDGKDLSRWQGPGGGPAKWKVENGYAEAVRGSGSIATKEALGDCQLHVEWSAPVPATGSGQGRGNSGILFFNRYEVQVLDSYENPTYPDGQAGAIYGTYPPLVNAMRKPGEWNVFDIVFTVPRFENEKLVKPGYFTVFHNGVLVQNHVELLGDSLHRALPRYRPHPPRGALVLQNHSNPVRYRNIWYREIAESDQP
jgi:3-keto-disaccharide hydrolase